MQDEGKVEISLGRIKKKQYFNVEVKFLVLPNYLNDKKFDKYLIDFLVPWEIDYNYFFEMSRV